jgi:hypothetical protein
MRIAVRQVGRHAGDAGDPCLGGRPLPTTGQSLAPSVHRDGPCAASEQRLDLRAASYPSLSNAGLRDRPSPRVSNRHGVSIKNRRMSLKTLEGCAAKSSHILGRRSDEDRSPARPDEGRERESRARELSPNFAAKSATPRFPHFHFPFSIFGIASGAHFHPSLATRHLPLSFYSSQLTSRIPRNSLKINDGGTRYPSLEPGGFGQP